MSNVPKDVEACCAEALGGFPILTVLARVKLLSLCLAKKTSSKTWAADVAKVIYKDRTLKAMFPGMASPQIVAAAHVLVKRHNRYIVDATRRSSQPSEPDVVTKVQCLLCNKWVSTAQALAMHMVAKHRTHGAPNASTAAPAPATPAPAPAAPAHCEKCGKDFKTPQGLVGHARSCIH